MPSLKRPINQSCLIQTIIKNIVLFTDFGLSAVLRLTMFVGSLLRCTSQGRGGGYEGAIVPATHALPSVRLPMLLDLMAKQAISHG